MSLSVKGAVAMRHGRPVRYMGDPGIFSTIVKGVKGAWKGITGQLDAPPQAMPGGGVILAPPTPTFTAPPPQLPAGMMGIPGVVGIDPLGAGRPGVAFGFGPGALAPQSMNGAGNLPPSGYRWNKTGYFLRSGQYVAPGTKAVKIRRRNSLNPRALSRAISRLDGAKRASKMIGRVSIRKTCNHK